MSTRDPANREPNGRRRRAPTDKPGRPTKLTPTIHEAIMTAVKGGMPLTTAALYVGVGKETFFAWCRKGRARDARQPFRRFVCDLDEALAHWEATKLLQISKAGDTEWQANAWLLERRFPHEYGRRTRTEIANADGRPFQLAAAPSIDPSKLTDQELEQLRDLLMKARPEPVEQRPQPLALPAGAA